jgi:hypothetical protein
LTSCLEIDPKSCDLVPAALALRGVYAYQYTRAGRAKSFNIVDMIKAIGSPRFRARIAGVLYLVIFIAAPSGAENATAVKMTITMVCDAGVALMFYNLLKPVSVKLSLLAAAFRLIFVAVMTVNSLNYFGCLVTGHLIFQSKFLPRVIGVLLSLAGLAYLLFIWPPLGDRLFLPFILVPGVVGEGSLTLWLLLVGVNAERWTQRASAAGPASQAGRFSHSRKTSS